MIKAIIFDADGVLINTEMFSKQYSKEFGISVDLMVPFFTGKFQECLVGKADLKREIKKHLSDWKWTKGVDELLKYWFNAEHKINQELIDYIVELKKEDIVCCLGTNQEKYRTEYMLNEMGFKNLLHPIFSSAYMGCKKPDQEFFQKILETLQLKKDQVLLWDDTTGHIKSAKEFGIYAEYYQSFDQFKKITAQYLS